MPELTIHLSRKTHEALRATATSRGKSFDEIIEESLSKSGLLRSRSGDVARSLREARAGSPLSDEKALELAVAETRAVRRKRLARQPPLPAFA